MCERDAGIFCPENPERIRALEPGRLLESMEGVHIGEFVARDAGVLHLAHDPEYVACGESADSSGRRALDRGDTRVTAEVFGQGGERR